jgi:DNA invertase Pin-like site-specific DNA recombinase
VREYVEQVSGGAPLDKRPVLLEALAATGVDGAGYLVVSCLDRFSRDPVVGAIVFDELTRHGASLACADGVGQGDDPTSMMIRGVLLCVKAYDRAMIGARIKATLAMRKRRGERVGREPFGSRVAADGQHVIVDGERKCRAACTGCRNLEREPAEHKGIPCTSPRSSALDQRGPCSRA